MDDRIIRLIAKADAALAQGNLTSAQLAMNKLRRQSPDAPELAMLDAQFGFLTGDIVHGTNLLNHLSCQESLSAQQSETLLGLLRQFELYFAAVRVLRRLTVIEPDNFSYQADLAALLLQTGSVAEAITLLTHCLARTPDNAALYLLLGHAFKALPDTQKAADAYHKYMQLQPESQGSGYWSLADLKHYQFSEDDQRHLRDSQSTDTYQQGLLCFARHHMYHQTGDKQAARAQLHEANALMRKVKPFHREGFQRLVEDLQASSVNPAPYSSAQTPIFIVGLPRSGTTLTEQILAAHSQITTTDELPYIERIALYLSQQGKYPHGLSQVSEAEKEKLREFYLSQAKQYGIGEATYFIDKNPNNILHLGLIHTLFPDAPVICLSRPVLDNASSLYRQFFSQGNDYSYAVSDINYYIEGVYQLLAKWQKTLGKTLQVVDYASLVESPEQTITALFDRLGIAFEPACLRFYEADTPVLTPSASQVRQPITNASLGSGNRYRDLFDGVSPSIDALSALRDDILNQ